MVVPVVHGARRDCGCADCPPPGDCPDGEECLPSNFVAPCADGEECLPSDFIDPDDCPPGGCDVLDPTTIDGLLAWYDADDESTFTFTSGIEVDTWADKSGNGNDMVTNNAFGGNPSRVVNAANGRAGVYSGITFAVDSGSMVASFPVDAPFQLVFAAQWNEPPGDGQSPAVGTGGDTWGIFRSGDGDLTVVANGGGHEQGFLTEDVPHIVSIAFDDGVDSVYRIDGVEVFAGDLGIAGQTAMIFFQNAGGGFSLKGFMFEWMTFDRILSEEELACVEAGLALRWMTGTCPECPEVLCDEDAYQPYCIGPENADDPDTVILATNPFGYWKLDDASGNPQDSSGNGNHATSVQGTPQYAQTAISGKTDNSMLFEGNESVLFPLPSNLNNGATEVAAMALISVEGTGNDGDGNTPWRGLMGGSAQEGWELFFFDAANSGSGWLGPDGILAGLARSNNVRFYGSQTLFDTGYAASQPHVFVLNGKGGSMEVWVDGVLWIQAERNDNPGSNFWLYVGADPNTFWGACNMRASNVAAWDHALTRAEIESMTEALMDAAMIADGWTPA